MYKEHNALMKPTTNCKLWQYMSFSKFVNLLIGKMYFRRLDSFEDVFEGQWPKMNKKYIEYVKEKEGDTIGSFTELGRKLLYVSCFHKSDAETAFMWKQYANTDGIAIYTSFERLRESFTECDQDLFISDVNYIDYTKEAIFDMSNMLVPAIYKRDSFRFEQEVRCISMLDDLHTNMYYREESNNKKIDFDKLPVGIKLPVNLFKLIEKIYISPYAEGYIEENVKDCLKSKGLDIPVI